MALYHLNAKTGSRAGGQSAGAKSDYINREGKYGVKEPEIVTMKESGNMPEWAQSPTSYWKAADLFERENGRLYKEIEFALPVELTPSQRHELAGDFCRELAQTPDGPLPYSFAVHDKGDGNPHCHLIVSERVNDGMDRTADTWFKRANGKEPGKGGARKTESLKPQEWLHRTREKWADTANAALERAGHDVRISHKSLEEQGIDRIAQIHIGPGALALEEKGFQTDRGEAALVIARENEQRDREIAAEQNRGRVSAGDRTVGAEYGGPGGRFADNDGAEPERGQQDHQRDQREDRSGGPQFGNGWSHIESGIRQAFAELAERDREYERLRVAAVSTFDSDRAVDRDNSIERIYSLADVQSVASGGRTASLGMEQHGQKIDGRPADRGKEHGQGISWASSDRASQKDRTAVSTDRTAEAVRNQIRAMGCKSFEIGIREQETGKMMNREMTVGQVTEAVPWLKRMNAQGNDIYIRPGRAEARALVLVDDVDGATIDAMKERGISPACVVQTSHKNLQAWVSVGEKPMPEAQRTELAKFLAKELGADPASAEGRHYGRLAGFTNRKPEHLQHGGFPYVLCKESSGRHAEQGDQLRAWAERQVYEQEQAKKRAAIALERVEAIKTAKRAYMYTFRASPEETYTGYMQEWLKHIEAKGEKPDWSKGDYAVSCRMLSSGQYSVAEVAKAIEDHSPDIPARKGEHAADYAQRTVAAAERNPKVQEELAKRLEAAERNRSRGPSLGR